MTRALRPFLAAVLLSLPLLAPAQSPIRVQDPWIRGTVAQQKATGLFAQITAPTDARLVAAQAAVAGVVEIHEMTMDGSIMRMRAIPGLDLPAGKSVVLKPGGYHVMLMDLKRPLQTGESVPVTLIFERNGQRETIDLQAPVRPLATPSPQASHRH